MNLLEQLSKYKNVDHNLVLLTDKETGIIIGGEDKPIASGTLANWRSNGRHHLKFIKIGSLVRYRLSNILEWLNNHEADIGDTSND